MSDMIWDLRESDLRDTDVRDTGPWLPGGAPHTGQPYGDPAHGGPAYGDQPHVERVTAEGADWLASASTFPRSVRALWSARPGAPSVLPCGTAFDVVNLPVLFGRRVLDRLWESGPGCGPVAVHRGRMLVFATPGTGRRLPSLLSWEEWGPLVPPMLCHGVGDAVTVPPLAPAPAAAAPGGNGGSRWLVAPGVRDPWLPGPAVLLWACLRAARPHRVVAGGVPV
ncbi:bifunctional DNA primase/polymerase [Streptantibioticus silvisoli]|uniref:Bifunctional DNA primase/polymerase n=1 Tax=Streptantibioticus silvisoli TaxID=2705255 RepID=A0ABT6W8Y8_9ACTN|nr:bifunctional DNA primase/polymerase [Streptantibioticus silvisoli]MDI5967205.1 bifunctional DNA primase/polymerase [Streptantibioticus silvisoli]